MLILYVGNEKSPPKVVQLHTVYIGYSTYVYNELLKYDYLTLKDFSSTVPISTKLVKINMTVLYDTLTQFMLFVLNMVVQFTCVSFVLQSFC